MAITIANFTNNIKNTQDVYSVEKAGRIPLKEEEQGEVYSIEFKYRTQADAIIVLVPSKIKEAISFLKQLPKDCDYIIVDVERKKIFCIELKKSTNNKRQDILSQVKGGEYILNMMAFLSQSVNLSEYSDQNQEYDLYYLGCRKEARRDRVYRKEDDGMYLVNGANINLDTLVRQPESKKISF